MATASATPPPGVSQPSVTASDAAAAPESQTPAAARAVRHFTTDFNARRARRSPASRRRAGPAGAESDKPARKTPPGSDALLLSLVFILSHLLFLTS
ncbi:MAG: hypothetical protein LBT40_05390 [Deltaproteobacteria bacterium]|nr:hypothetical protein [Deltaproteobacteria bacterium]